MSKQAVVTLHAPQAIGPYSQGIVAGNLVFTSGQIAIDPATGKLIEGDVEAQAHQVMKNLEAVLIAAKCEFSHVVKATVFLANITDFARVNSVYAEYFTTPAPARSAVQVAALPLGALVEIECIAMLPT